MRAEPPRPKPAAPPAPWAWPAPWVRAWRRDWLRGDLTAGVVVAVMLVPQSMAYAMLAGLPPQAGLLASLLPLLAYAAFGTSSALSVGPGAITALMVAQTLAPLADAGSLRYAALAWVLALGSGGLLMLMGLLRMGFLSQLLSQPVVQGFTAASALLILLGQMAPLLGMPALGHTLPEMAHALWQRGWAQGLPSQTDTIVGLASLGALALGRPLMHALGRAVAWPAKVVDVLVKLWPIAVLLGAAGLAHGLVGAWPAVAAPALVGQVHMDGLAGMLSMGPGLALGAGDLRSLAMPILLLGLVGFVSSMSVAQAFALKRGERIDADRELLGLGLANVGSTFLGGMPVSGGMSRSVVNEAAGARSPLAGIISAVLLAVLLLGLMPWLADLPKAALAAIIIYAISALVELRSLKAAWRYDRAEGGAFVSTALGVLLIGFDAGMALGMAWSLGAMVWRHSQPHVAEVGRLPGSAHFRNVARHEVETLPGVLMVRVDESLDFTNVQRVELRLAELMATHAQADHVVLLLSAVNHVDHTAVQAVWALDAALAEQGKTLYLAEVKGPVMDRLRGAGVAARFEGRLYLSAQRAWEALSGAGGQAGGEGGAPPDAPSLARSD